jgi:hypothetical protein
MLHEFVPINREAIIGRCRSKVAERSIPPCAERESDHGIPLFLNQLVGQLRVGRSSTLEIRNSAIEHGSALLRRGYTAAQVVNDYVDVCQAVTELALEENVPISTEDFRKLNQCLDVAVAARPSEEMSDRR